MADSEDLQAKIGEDITGDALGAAHGCEFSIEDLQASAELSGGELEGVPGGLVAIAIKDAMTLSGDQSPSGLDGQIFGRKR